MPVTNFFWEPLSDNILQERDEFGALTAEYTTEPGLYGNVVSQNRSGVESQFHFDAVGSTLALTDGNQQVTDSRFYMAFGETVESTGSTSLPFQYIGQMGYYRSSVTGEYLVRMRGYEPTLARWLSSDPLHFIMPTWSAFIYSTNSPTLHADPSGFAPLLTELAFDPACAGCTGHFVAFNYNVPSVTVPIKLAVVQKIILTFTIWYCRKSADCSGMETCQVVKGESRCDSRRWEYLGTIEAGPVAPGNPTNVPGAPAQDTWQFPMSGSKDYPCEMKGTIVTWATVRAFRYRPALDPHSGVATDLWKDGKGLKCGGIPLDMSMILDTEPRWWGTHVYETKTSLYHHFNCCVSKPKDMRSTLEVSYQSSDAPKTQIFKRKDCLDFTELPKYELP